MNSKQTPLRVLGQSSIASSFLSRSSNSCLESKKDSRISLSDFLDRKLHKTSALSKIVQEKSRPFSSLGSPGDVERSKDGQAGDKKEGEGERSRVLDKVVFEQFKNTGKEEDSTDEEGISNTDEVQNSRKRKNPFEGINDEHRMRKSFLVLGDDPKPKQQGRGAGSTSNKKPRPSYNHYANGHGWWDYDMEGIDVDEVGYGEIWEGVGSTTLGGVIDWR